MIWSDFMAIVNEHLGVDAARRGTENLRNRASRDAIMDLQRFIRAYRQGHQTTYLASALTEESFAHLGQLPAQAKPKAFYIVSTAGSTITTGSGGTWDSLLGSWDDLTGTWDSLGGTVVTVSGATADPNCKRNRLDRVAWEDRRAMICGRVGCRRYLYAISPFSKQFLVHPLINDETELLVVWDGLKMTFADGDEVPFPDQAAEAVAAYMKWKLLLEVDKRLDLAREQYALYQARRLSLYREEQESQEADGRDEEAITVSPTPTGNLFDDLVGPFDDLVGPFDDL